jgi:dihydrofolate synthase / folylpolyglutamate synthase
LVNPHDYLAALRPHAIRLGLERVARALDDLGRPDRALRVLHVAGTNGKGSTCAMADAALRAAGHRVGLYTSPHLERFSERIRVDGREISDAALARRVEAVRRACPWHERSEEERLTYFEFATLLAILHFAEEGVSAAVLEVGLGGRFDATTAVTPLACAISRIGLDHVELLGPTLAHVAREKAGILKPGVPAVTVEAQPAEALAVLREEATARGASLALAAPWDGPRGLRGPHQRENAGLAAAALRLLDAAGVAVPEAAIRAGIAGARWPGRLEEVGGVLLDGAHNPDGAAALAAALAELHPGRPVELVFGVLADKDLGGMLAALAPAVRAFHLVAPGSPRARDPLTYVEQVTALGRAAHVHAELAGAIAAARAAAARDGALTCVAGSFYVVGAARALLAAHVGR